MKKSAKGPFIGLVIAVIGAVLLFSLSRRYPNLLWPAAGVTGVALLLLLVALTRFLRNRSIVSGLFISTTAVTILYFLGTRFVNTAIPIAISAVTASNIEAVNNSPSWFNPVLFAQIGLFVLWFLLILFIIYVYVRPIKKIDYLLSQIIEAKEIKKLKLGKSAQYQKIAAKLRVLADEKHHLELKKQQRSAQARARANQRKDLVNQLLKEKDKIPRANACE